MNAYAEYPRCKCTCAKRGLGLSAKRLLCGEQSHLYVILVSVVRMSLTSCASDLSPDSIINVER